MPASKPNPEKSNGRAAPDATMRAGLSADEAAALADARAKRREFIRALGRQAAREMAAEVMGHGGE